MNRKERKQSWFILRHYSRIWTRIAHSVIWLAMYSTFMDKNFSVWHQYPDWLCSSFISLGTRGSFHKIKHASTWCLTFTSVQCSRLECVEIYLHVPLILSWHVVREEQLYTFTATQRKPCKTSVTSAGLQA
jgi:hypothetical protein